MIPDGVGMMVRKFRRGKFSINNLRVGVDFFIGGYFPPREVVPGKISQDNPPGKFVPQEKNWTTLRVQIVPVDVLG